jgi:predicted small lipoprotein YifL
VTSSSDRRLSRLAVAVALIAALGLAACGRKGALEAPPSAAIDQPGAAAMPSTPSEAVQGVMQETGGPTPPPIHAKSPQKRIFLDWLLD